MLLESAIMCIALNVYFEARGEPINGQVAVALVTMNRAKWDHKQVCAEVVRPAQFSWTADRIEWHRGKPRLKAQYEPKEFAAWNRAYRIAIEVALHRYHDFTRGATHFHAPYVDPLWRHRLTRVMQIGGHIFYRET
jgi:N-acetylmuramoyl-L-alanine amidase